MEGNLKIITYSLQKSACTTRKIPNAAGFGKLDFESTTSTNSITPAWCLYSIVHFYKKCKKNIFAMPILWDISLFYFFSSREYPLPYWTHLDTRLSVAEEMSACAMTWL